MKKILFPFITILVTSIINFSLAQSEESEQKAPEFLLDKKEFNSEKILKLLFEGKYYSEYTTIAWKPYPKENVPVSFDGLCYTDVDTTLYYKNDTLNYALVILNSIEHNEFGGVNDCAGCPPTEGLALFLQENNNWKLISFDHSVAQLGQMAMVPDKKIIQISENDFVLALIGSVQAGGGIIAPEYEYWFHLSEYGFTNIFVYYPLSTPDNQFVEERKIELVKSEESEFYEIILKTVLVDYESEKHKLLKSCPDEKYEYKYDFNGYVLKK